MSQLQVFIVILNFVFYVPLVPDDAVLLPAKRRPLNVKTRSCVCQPSCIKNYYSIYIYIYIHIVNVVPINDGEINDFTTFMSSSTAENYL